MGSKWLAKQPLSTAHPCDNPPQAGVRDDLPISRVQARRKRSLAKARHYFLPRYCRISAPPTNSPLDCGICPIFNSKCRRVRFARFYIVCEEVPLGTPESPPIVSGVSDMHPSVSKRGRDTESDAVIRLEEIHTFFSNECFLCSSTRNLHHVLPVILLIINCHL